MSDPIPSRAWALSRLHSVSLLVPPPDRLAPVRVSVFLRAPLSFTHVSLFPPPVARVINPCGPSAVVCVVIMSSILVGHPSRESPPTPSRGGSSAELPALPPLSGASAPSRTVPPPGSSGGSVLRRPRGEGFVPPAAPSLPPFHKHRGPRGPPGRWNFVPPRRGPRCLEGASGYVIMSRRLLPTTDPRYRE